ncbi:MAG TPA: DUF5616 domain-containing protein, partial [Opitutus sp.]|nr:DUF5616 domain-containing protein [Opitutus sp.]
SALAGGVVLLGRDGCCRDMASLHGTYRQVEETLRAAELIGTFAVTHHVTRCRWLLDRPVNNSGRLKTLLLDLAEKFNWPWDVELEFSPDTSLSQTTAIVATSDSVILDRCEQWCNAAHEIIAASLPETPIIDLRPAPC